MARLTLVLSLSLLFSCLPTVLAGPACAKKYHQAAGCIERCKHGWGWSNKMMGTDPWGLVVHTGDWDAAIAAACGSALPSKASSSMAATPTDTASSTVSVAQTMPTPSPPTPLTPSSSPVVLLSASLFTFTYTSSSTIVVPKASSRLITSTRIPIATQAPQPSPTTVVSSTTTSQAPPTTGGAGTSSADIHAYLAAHNDVRAEHGASPLTWSNDLASKAQQWANGCEFQHSGGSLGAFGENLAAGTGDYTIANAVKGWTDEVSEYNPNDPVPSHFTQVVWKATTQVGCAVQTCNGIFPSNYGPAKYYVCEYFAQGNVIGEFAQNVQV